MSPSSASPSPARCSGSCAGTSTRHRSSWARAARCSSATRWQCSRSSAPPRWRWRCWCWACRSSTRSGSSSGALAAHRSPFTPDRGHIHHRLLDLGLSHTQTVLLIYALCIGLAVLAFVLSGAAQLYAFAVFVVVAGLMFYALSRRAGRLPPTQDERAPRGASRQPEARHQSGDDDRRPHGTRRTARPERGSAGRDSRSVGPAPSRTRGAVGDARASRRGRPSQLLRGRGPRAPGRRQRGICYTTGALTGRP